MSATPLIAAAAAEPAKRDCPSDGLAVSRGIMLSVGISALLWTAIANIAYFALTRARRP